MVDEPQQVEKEVDSQPSESTTENIDESQNEDVQPQDDEVSEESGQDSPEPQEAEEPTVVEKKENRAERRIRQLSSRLKDEREAKKDFTSFSGSVVNPEDMENGLDPKELDRRIQQREQNLARSIKSELAYEKAQEDHLSDLGLVEEKLGENPSLEKIAVRQYEAVNYMIDPVSGNRVFVPVVKMSEIVSSLEKDLEPLMTRATSDVSKRLHEQSESAALRPTSTTTSGEYDSQAAFDRAVTSGSTEDWQKVLKTRVFNK